MAEQGAPVAAPGAAPGTTAGSAAGSTAGLFVDRIGCALGRLLEACGIALLVVLSLVVVYGVAARYVGRPPGWYDEVASLLLAWLSFFGAALAALGRGHLGFDNLFRAMPRAARRWMFVAAESVVILFFAALAWGGWRMLAILEGETLISLPSVPAGAAHVGFPIAAVLFVAAELTTVPAEWRRLAAAEGSQR